MSERLRILIAKPGLDGHDRGAKVIARALRDAGMEVIYTGLRQTPEMIVEAALQEDVDAVGLSILSGAHMTLVPRVVEGLGEAGLDRVKVFIGGIIPDEDVLALKGLGVAGIFGPGANTQEIADFIRQQLTGGGRGTGHQGPERQSLRAGASHLLRRGWRRGRSRFPFRALSPHRPGPRRRRHRRAGHGQEHAGQRTDQGAACPGRDGGRRGGGPQQPVHRRGAVG